MTDTLDLRAAALRIGVPSHVLHNWVWADFHYAMSGREPSGPPYVGTINRPEFNVKALDGWVIRNVAMVGDLH